MDTSVIQSYLVGLGFSVDQNGLRKFQTTLDNVDRYVNRHTSSVAGEFTKMASTIAGAYAAIGVSAIALADHVAQTDLQFQLGAMRAYMTTDAYKKMTIATDALGHSLDEIAWNPELRERYKQLIQDQDKLQRQLGVDYPKQLKAIRDLRFEFSRLGVAVEYLGMSVVGKTFKGLGVDAGTIEERLKHLNEWIDNGGLDQVAERIARVLTPVLKEAGVVASDVWAGLHKLTEEFVNLIGELTGDKALQGPLTFEKLEKAVVAVNAAVSNLWADIVKVFKAIDNYGNALDAAQKGQWGKAKELFNKGSEEVLGVKSLTESMRSSDDARIMRWLGKVLRQASPMGRRPGETAWWEDIPGSGEKLGGLLPAAPKPLSAGGTVEEAGSNLIISKIIEAAKKYDIPPEIAIAVAQRESNFNPQAVSPKGALGVMQLMPDTAKQLNVDPRDWQQNVEGGSHYLRQMFDMFGDWEKALAAYNWGPGHVSRDKPLGRLPAETQDYLNAVEGRAVEIHSIVIHADKSNLTSEELKAAVVAAIREELGKTTQRNLAMLGGPYH